MIALLAVWCAQTVNVAPAVGAEAYTSLALDALERQVAAAPDGEHSHALLRERRRFCAEVLADELDALGYADGAAKVRCAGRIPPGDAHACAWRPLFDRRQNPSRRLIRGCL